MIELTVRFLILYLLLFIIHRMCVHNTYMMQDSGLRYQVPVDKGLGVFYGDDADFTIHIGNYTGKEQFSQF